jgi:putative flippase GtrA
MRCATSSAEMRENMNLGKYQKIYDKFINRETISYTIAGVLTTVVNFASYYALFHLGMACLGKDNKGFITLTANAIAWLIAVIFAYVVNRNNVFQSSSDTIKDEVSKIGKFFGARLVTLGAEEFGMYLFSVLMNFNSLLVKAVLAVFVIIINYVFSKVYIFKK